jgi:hypothetical protein
LRPERLAFKSLTMSVEFDYVRSVPVPVLMQSRMQSRSLGSRRVDEGNEVEFQYEEEAIGDSLTAPA